MRRPRGPLTVCLIALSCLLAFPARAAEAAGGERVATIIIQGLQRIDRERLLEDLRLNEGDPYQPGLEKTLEARAERLPYLQALRAESESGRLGRHLTLWVREASRLRVRPFFMVLEDGDLSGGFHIDSDGLLTRSERWRGTLLVGGRTEIALQLNELKLGPAWLPALNADLGLDDWDQPFWDTQARRWWVLAGPSFALPKDGRILLLAGKERIETTPPRGYDPAGKDEHALYRALWTQPLRKDGLEAELFAEHRVPGEAHEYARATLSLEAWTRLGLWHLSGKVASGRAMHASPITGLFYLDSWRYLRAFDAGSLPAREFHFLRLRSDLKLFDLPVRVRRGGQEQLMSTFFFLMAEGALLRVSEPLDFTDASDLGLGLALRLPGPIPTRASFAILWNNLGDVRSVFTLEEL